MHYRVIQQAIKAQPFAPFDVIMSSGESYRVGHPENLMILKDCVLIPIYKRRPPSPDGRADDFVSASYLHIAALERTTPAESVGENNPPDRIP